MDIFEQMEIRKYAAASTFLFDYDEEKDFDILSTSMTPNQYRECHRRKT